MVFAATAIYQRNDSKQCKLKPVSKIDHRVRTTLVESSSLKARVLIGGKWLLDECLINYLVWGVLVV